MWVKVEYQMWDANESHLKSLMWTDFIHIDLQTKKVENHPEDVMTLLSEFVFKLENIEFKDRLEGLLKK